MDAMLTLLLGHPSRAFRPFCGQDGGRLVSLVPLLRPLQARDLHGREASTAHRGELPQVQMLGRLHGHRLRVRLQRHVLHIHVRRAPDRMDAPGCS